MDTQDELTDYWVLAYYFLTDLADPEEMVREHKRFCGEREMRGRVYLAREGINGTVSAPRPVAQGYMDWLRGQPQFADVTFKIQAYHEHVFEKMIIKTRPELVALGCSVDRRKGGAYLTPAAWRDALERDDEKIILDVRNDYEWKLGHFQGAECVACTTFKEFRDYAAQLKRRTQVEAGNQSPKVLMYCTGGIRCELFSALLRALTMFISSKVVF